MKKNKSITAQIIKISYIPFDQLVNNYKNNCFKESNSFNSGKDLSRGLFPEIKLSRQLSVMKDLNNLLISVS